ncbi:MAG: sigma-54-dependent transcriptional regulator [Candidatus Hydrogenedentota bacterium]
MEMESITGTQTMLVVDDKLSLRRLLAAAFKDRGFDVTTAANGDEAVTCVKEQPFDVIITDLKMPGKDGIDVLRAAKEVNIETEVILVSAYGTLETAVKAMRYGAHDFIAKPFKLAEIELKVDKILQKRKETSGRLPSQAAARGGSSGPTRIIGNSQPTRQLLKMIRKIGQSKSSVLITGPSGVGKELVAKEVHDNSPRRDKPFVAVNCAALAPGVLESELFGHEKGAFTGAVSRRPGRFERAHTGTLFLDEVAEIDTSIQTKLLRVLQENEFERVGGTGTISTDVRIVAATNRDLREAIARGLFREDFYYRLNVFSLHVPPLHQRRDDIADLVQHFLKKFSQETGKRVTSVDPEVMALFMRYPWPGNIRELENVLERAVVLAETENITVDEIPHEMFFEPERPQAVPGAANSSPQPNAPRDNAPMSSQPSLIEQKDQMESELIYGALQRFRWNKTKTAEHLGLKRTTLQYKIKKYGLE